MQRLKQSININVYALELEANQSSILLPDCDSQLMKKQGVDYLEGIEKGTYVKFRKDNSSHSKCKFLLTDVPDKSLCFAIMAAAINQHMIGKYADFKFKFGFDMNCLPDHIFMLRVLYSINKEHPIIEQLPLKTDDKLTDVQRSALISTLSSGGDMNNSKKFQIPKSVSKPFTEGAVGYVLINFQMKELKSQTEAIMKMAQSNPMLKDLYLENKEVMKSIMGTENTAMIMERRD